MIKLEEKNGMWYDIKGKFIGKIVKVKNSQVMLRTKDGDLKELLYGWLDENGNFYKMCSLPYTYCVANCTQRNAKICRYNIMMTEEGFYISE